MWENALSPSEVSSSSNNNKRISYINRNGAHFERRIEKLNKFASVRGMRMGGGVRGEGVVDLNNMRIFGHLRIRFHFIL